MHEKSKRRARAINQENLLSGWGLALQENLLKQDTLGMNEYRTKFIINIITSLQTTLSVGTQFARQDNLI
jgi:hypothetical protein